MSKKGELLFSYGTLQDPAIQQAVFSRKLNGEQAVLPGFRLEKRLVYDRYDVVVADPGSETKGWVYTLEANEMAKADAYEGPGYRREKLPLLNGDLAWVYLKNSN